MLRAETQRTLDGTTRQAGGWRNPHLVPRQRPRASILLVDDVPANLLALEAVLEPLGQDLVRACSGEEALRHLAEREFAVILMDALMPGIDGYETAARIREREATRLTPIIFITAGDFEEDRVMLGYSRGAVDFLIKPFNPLILTSKVAVLVELYLSRETVREQAAALREAEREALERQSATRLQTIFDLMPLCVVALHADGQPYFCNRSWREYTGIDLSDGGGMTLLDAVHPEDRVRARDTLLEALAAGRPVEIECRLRCERDGFRWHVARALPEVGADGTIIGWIATAADVERQKQAEQQANAANKMKDQFLAVVSHELRAPLTAILGWTGILQSSPPDATRLSRGLETIQRNARAQAHLIEDILDVARILSGKLRLEIGPMDVAAVVRAALDSARPAAEAKEVELEATFESVTPTEGDAERLQQVFSNLATNAIKFTPSRGKIRVDVRMEGEDIEVRFEDNGCGIDPEFIPHVFDRFRQADPNAGRREGGLGLGLAIVQHIVGLHDGTVAAKSSGAGQGSTFVVTLPVREGPLEETPISPSQAAMSSRASSILRGLKVLLVDDEPDSRDFLSQVLGSAGADVMSAGTSRDALDMFVREPPDVLLSDIGLPGEDGYSFIRQVRALAKERGGTIPALALTAYTRPEDAARAREAGFDMHVPKPIEPFEVVSVVAHLGQLRH
jgi:PAS domain S-box-containing protein